MVPRTRSRGLLQAAGRLLPAVALLVFAAAGAAEDFSEAEGKLRREAAGEILAFADACSKVGAKEAGLAAVEEARDLDPLAKDLKTAGDARAALPADAPDAASFPKKRAEAGKAVAKAYDRCTALKHDAKEDARFDDYSLRALRWDPSDARVKRAAAASEAASGGNRPVEAGLFLRGILRADPEGAGKGRYDALVDGLARKDPLLLGSAAQDLVAFVSLPKDWRKGKAFPVLVAVDGAGCDFLGCARGFAAARGSRPLIVVSPMTLSNTNDLLPAKYPAYPKPLLDRWNGNRDSPGIEPQTDAAAAALARLGYARVERTMVKGSGHSPLRDQVWKFVDEVMGVK